MERKTIDVQDLELDYETARVRATHGFNTEARMVSDLLEFENIPPIARKMVKGGKKITEPFCVIKSPRAGKYIVIDGNRRLCALRQLGEASHQKLPGKKAIYYQKLASVEGFTVPSEVACRVFPDRNTCYHWLASNLKRKPRNLANQFVEYARVNNLIPEKLLSRVNKDILARLLANNEIRGLMGITNLSQLHFMLPVEVFNDVVSQSISILSSIDFSSINVEHFFELIKLLNNIRDYWDHKRKLAKNQTETGPNNPFTPGPGIPPLIIAGRDSDIDAMRRTLQGISKKRFWSNNGHKVSRPILLLGCRGTGKTVLLQKACEIAQELKVPVVELTLSEKQSAVFGTVQKKGKSAYFQISREGVQDEVEFQARLTNKIGNGATLVVIDEAHTFPPELLRVICVSIQACLRQNKPVAHIMAGSPLLTRRLLRNEATFMEWSDLRHIGLLPEKSAGEAFREGFNYGGLGISSKALDELLTWSMGHPFFVQLVGATLWDCAKMRKIKEITADVVRECIAAAGRRRDKVYLERYMQLRDGDLLDVAVVVSGIVSNNDEDMDLDELGKSLVERESSTNIQEAMLALEQLLGLGYICEVGLKVVPGLPYLFNYVLENSKDRQREGKKPAN